MNQKPPFALTLDQARILCAACLDCGVSLAHLPRLGRANQGCRCVPCINRRVAEHKLSRLRGEIR